MDKNIEQLKKEAMPVNQKCFGKGLDKREINLWNEKSCDQIDPVETENGDGTVNQDFFNEACRCKAYVNPSAFWNRGGCPLASHIDFANEGRHSNKKRVGQQKQKKK